MMTLLKEDWRDDPTARRGYERMRRGESTRDRGAERLHRRMTNPGRTRYGPGAETTGRARWAREPAGAAR